MFSQTNVRRLLLATFGSVAALATASCGGSSGGPGPVPRVMQSLAPTEGTASVSFTVNWPKKGSATSGRRRDYLSNSTASVTLTVNGGTPTIVNNPNLSPGTASAFTQSTTVSVNAPVGNGDTFAVSAFDATGGGGNLLGAAQSVQAVKIDQVNVLTITLDGNLAKIVATPVTSPFISGTAGVYTVVGQAPQQFVLTPEDADGNIIIAPGTIPPLTLTSATPASVSEASTATTNEFNVQAHVPGVTITFTAAGTNLAGTAVKTTFTVTTVSAIYVTNHATVDGNESVTIYPSTATGDATPIATLKGGNTEQNQIQFDAVDSNGVLYVTNQGPKPGAVYGPTSGYLTIFNGSAQNGNESPTSVIASLAKPEGVAIDPVSNSVWVMQERSLVEYPASPTSASATIAAIGPPNPTAANPAPANNAELDGCYGVAVDSNEAVYAACQDVLNVYKKGTTGNTAPEYQVQPPLSEVIAGMQIYADNNWLTVATDASDNFYAPEFNNNLNGVEQFSAGANDTANSNAMPAFTAATGFDMPLGIAVDTTGAIYVVNYASNTINIYSSATNLELGNTSATITGADTGLDYPYGIAVR